jgi:hypothetical protein
MTDQRLQTGRFYRIKRRIIFCTRYSVHANKSKLTYDMEGFAPKDYDAYLAHCRIENQAPYRTIAEIEGIPFPDPIAIHFTHRAKIELLSEEEVLRTREKETEQ